MHMQHHLRAHISIFSLDFVRETKKKHLDLDKTQRFMFQVSNFSKGIIEFTHIISKLLNVFLWRDGTGFTLVISLCTTNFTACEFPVDLMAVAVASSAEVFD